MPSQKDGGVFYYRCLTPMVELKKSFPDRYEIIITSDLSIAWQKITNTDILIIHNCLYSNKIQMLVWNLVCEAKKIGVKVVLDIDDYWNYGEQHPLYNMCMVNQYPTKATVNLNLFDCITTTTERLKSEIYEYNPNVHILENAISENDTQFTVNKNPSQRLRFGITGSSSHTTDIKQIVNEEKCIFDYLDKDTIDKIQFVLCGFSIEGKCIKTDENGELYTEPLKPEDIWWVKLEKQITKDYTLVSPEYKELLLKYDRSDENYDASNEPYKRIWSKSITNHEYGGIYENIDVLMIPLTDTKFNSMKSSLKFVEAGFTNTMGLASNVKPYTDYGTNYKNCIFVEDMTPKGWADKITEIVNHPDERRIITEKLHNKATIEQNIDSVTIERDLLYRSLVGNTKRISY